MPWRDDPIKFAADAAAKLRPLGVKSLNVGIDGHLSLEFYEDRPEPPPVVVLQQGDGEESEEEQMEREPPADPLDDPMLYRGRKVPRHRDRVRKDE